jgi:hypothetical protein
MMPPEGCDRYRELIGAFVLGKLEGAELEAMQTHLNGCPECWAEARELGPVVAALAYADPERIAEEARPPGDLEESTLAPTPEEIHRGRRLGWLTPEAAAMAAAAIFAFLIGLGWHLSAPQDELTGSSSSSVPSKVDRAPYIAQGEPRAMGPEGRILPEESSSGSDVKGSSPSSERRLGAALEKSAPGRGVSAPPASALPTSAPAASAASASAASASAASASAPAASAPAASAPSQSSVPPSSAPPQSSVPPADSSAVPPESSVPPSSAAPASTPPEQQYR